MMRSGTTRKSGVAALILTAAVGVAMLPVFLPQEASDWPQPSASWWVGYLLYVCVLLMVWRCLPRPPNVSDGAGVVALVVLGTGVFALYPDHGWTAVLLIVTAATSAAVWQAAASAAVIVVQTIALGAGVASSGWPVRDVVLAVLIYGSFQVFAAVVVRTARREGEARGELALAHAELHAAAARLEASSRDAERLRISRDLHDVMGHKLTALTLELEVTGHLVDGDGAEHADRALAIARDLLGDVRAAVGQLRASRHDLEPMLRSLTEDIPGLNISLRVVEAGPVEAEQAQVVLRCVQEAITNTLRHAGAEHLDVVVVADASGLRIEARDDGHGVDAIVAGNGLTGMRERFEALGGTLQLGSGSGGGFLIAGQLPARRPAGRTP
jgi:signal transduction histidine kinase